MVVTLIGFRGVGKSSVAPQLAARLNCRCVDADEEIARRAGRPIVRIFAEQGEPAFRRLEAEVIADLLQRGPLVLAVGGGAVLNAETLRRMQAAGPVVWLQAGLGTIWSRIGCDLSRRGSRPALTELDPRAEAETLLRQREPVYRDAAAFAVSTDDRGVAAVVDDIVSQLPPRVEPTE